MSLLDQIPGYRAAVEAESCRRDEAYLDVPYFLNGIEAVAFTPRHNLILSSVHNPLAVGGSITPADVALFLWAISPQFSTNKAAREEFTATIAKLDYQQTVDAITTYLDDMFEDAPGASKSKQAEGAFTPSYWSDATDLIDLFSTEYGWSWREILSTPYPVLWQQLRRIHSRCDPSTIHFNRSDQVRGKWLAAQSAPVDKTVEA